MGILNKLVNSIGGDIADSVADYFTQKQLAGVKKEELKVEVQRLVDAAIARQLEHIENLEAQITERHKNDMASDSWLSKNIRPLTLAFLTTSTTFLAYLSIFMVKTEIQVQTLQLWIGLFTALLVGVYSFYFGSRGLEKVTAIIASVMRKKDAP